MDLLRTFGLSILTLICSSGLARAQLDFGKRFELDALAVGEADLDAQKGDLSWGRLKFDYNRPWLDVAFDPSREWGVFWGLEADYTRFDFGEELSGFEDLDLFRLRVPWQFLYKPGGMRSEWTFAAMIAPGIASDLEGFEFDDFTLDALLIGLYRFNKNWEVGAGVYYSNSLGLPFPVPSIGVNWTPHEDFSLRAFPPIISAKWQLSEHWASELFLRPAGGLWNLHGDRPEGADKLSLNAWMAGLGVAHEFGSASSLNLSTGVIFGHRMEFVDADNDKVLGSDLDPALFLGVGYEWEF